MARYPAVYRVFAGDKPPLAAEPCALLLYCHAVRAEHGVKRGKRPFAKPPFHYKYRFRPKRPNYRQKEAQRGAGFAAVQLAYAFGRGGYRLNVYRVARARYVSAKGAHAAYCGFNIL